MKQNKKVNLTHSNLKGECGLCNFLPRGGTFTIKFQYIRHNSLSKIPWYIN